MTYETHAEVVEKAIRMADGVDGVETDVDESTATVEGDTAVDELVEKIEMAGYDAEPL
ncbi:Heavy-metal-associated domain-containing protein [Haloarchaeobius iranensis]|uniref:Heavy-metal-associated domain-containing protein n=2 Tax=Haloarchaeobius iranensis TaxID=996166 RepID=A0A1G9TUI1_9EURY|nr:Heavy-metal-associated domain-containing protein [Haloarchaeobius iranensis]